MNPLSSTIEVPAVQPTEHEAQPDRAPAENAMADDNLHDETEYLTKTQVAELFNLTPAAFDHATSGTLASVRTRDGRRCYPADPVFALARSRGIPIPNPPPATHRHDHNHHYTGRSESGKRPAVRALASLNGQPNRDHPPPTAGSIRGKQRRALECLATILRAQGHPPWQIAAEIARLAGITQLWAWRLVHGWTRPELLQQLHQLRDTTIDQSMLWRWERGERDPIAQHLDALCRVYRTRADRLGYGCDYTPPSTGEEHGLHTCLGSHTSSLTEASVGQPSQPLDPTASCASAQQHPTGATMRRQRDAGHFEIDTTRPNPARVYDALLGGKDNFPADRDAAHAILNIAPQAGLAAKQNRAFLQRAVRYLAAAAGIRQFLDIGTGLPTGGNVHELAQTVALDARVVYVDNDPVVHVHANALLADQTTTAAVLGDLRDPQAILGDPQVRRLLDFTQPIGVLLVAVLHFVRDAEDPAGILAQLRAAMAPGSFLVLSHATSDLHPEQAAKVTEVYQQASAPLVLRNRHQVERFFDGFDLVAPGLVQPAAWRPDDSTRAGPSADGFYGGVGRTAFRSAQPQPTGPVNGGDEAITASSTARPYVPGGDRAREVMSIRKVVGS